MMSRNDMPATVGAAYADNAPAALGDAEPRYSEIEMVLAISDAYRQGRRDALVLPPENAVDERLAWRNAAICGYALAKHPRLAHSKRASAEAVAGDIRRHPAIREALGGEVLGVERIRKILSGRW